MFCFKMLFPSCALFLAGILIQSKSGGIVAAADSFPSLSGTSSYLSSRGVGGKFLGKSTVITTVIHE